MRSVFLSVDDWNNAKDRLKKLYANYFAQYETCKRCLVIVSQQNLDNYRDTDDNEENDSSKEGKDDDRFTFVLSFLDYDPALDNGMSEA